MLSCAPYAPDPEEMTESYQTACNIYRKYKKYPEALRVAQKMNDMDVIGDLMEECTDNVTLKQMAIMLGRQRNPYVSPEEDL